MQHEDTLLSGEVFAEYHPVIAAPRALADDARFTPVKGEERNAVQKRVLVPLSDVVEHGETWRQTYGAVVRVPRLASVTHGKKNVLLSVIGELCFRE